jgi:P4 family phage/plasmid primase-like protien
MPRRGVPKASDSGSDPSSLRSARPWGNFAKKYFDAGWCPLPLPPRRKKSPPTGTTGKYDMPDKKKLIGWHKSHDARGNIAVRVPEDVIGIDVDAYDAKIGLEGLRTMEKEFGTLPDTWTLTSRRDGTSGIRFYKVPAGLHWPGEPVPDIQIVQNHHRYAVAYPSVHPDTRGIYLWYAPGDALDGRPSVTVENEIPNIADLPELPETWVEGLTSGKLWEGKRGDANASSADILDWIKARPAGTMCRLMRKQAEATVAEISVGGAHDAVNSRIYTVVALASEGHSGVSRAVRAMRDAFYAEVTQAGRKGRRSRVEATNEFNRMRDGAVRITMASVADGESALEEECGCAGNSLDWGEKLGIAVEESAIGDGRAHLAKMGKAKAPDKYPFDDSGNAEHLLDVLDGSALWVSRHKSWYFWNTARGSWEQDANIIEAAQIVGKRCREQADDLTERLISQGSTVTGDVGGDTAAKIKQLYAHANKSSNFKGLSDMGKVAASQRRAKASWTDFDVDPELIACSNGTIELRESGIDFRPARREDMLSLNTGTDFDPDATSAAWQAYLDRFVPDLEIREYIQKISGLALYGTNRERKLFLFVGETSSGKTTFVNALTSCLGEYATTFNLSLFRANQDEKARADIVNALPKRLITSSEASSKWELHADHVKRLTGGDPISGRKLYSSDYVVRKPAFLPIIATNSTPSIKGADAATRRRVVSVNFDVTISEREEDPSIGAALSSAEGRAGVLAWAVRGWEMYREAGGLGGQPKAVAASTAASHAQFSNLARFLADCTVPGGAGNYIVFSDLDRKWEMWCDAERIPERDRPSVSVFGAELSGFGYPSKLRKISGKPVRVRTGLSWRNGRSE